MYYLCCFCFIQFCYRFCNSVTKIGLQSTVEGEYKVISVSASFEQCWHKNIGLFGCQIV
ncbi:hypothetical protein Lalb_Chr13g0297691 [Lupinus albus]|uniref:Uncharacterized protein n=1 Tax=Lupinus albus TaxID=3870 RepID=A0A6A4PJB6_LUPAL|nr:hypothetical protein Lalb_Chr13g0297691 [Lupinus albus]